MSEGHFHGTSRARERKVVQGTPRGKILKGKLKGCVCLGDNCADCRRTEMPLDKGLDGIHSQLNGKIEKSPRLCLKGFFLVSKKIVFRI